MYACRYTESTVGLFTGNPTPKQAGAGTESPSDLPSHLDYPIIFEQPALEEGRDNLIGRLTLKLLYYKHIQF